MPTVIVKGCIYYILGNCLKRLAIRDILSGWGCQGRKAENVEKGSKCLCIFGVEHTGQLFGYSNEHNSSLMVSLVNVTKDLQFVDVRFTQIDRLI